MAETYDIAPYDPTVKQDPDLFDSAGTGLDPYDTAEEAMRQIPVAEPVDEPTPSPTPATLSAAENVPAPIPPPDPLPFLNEEPPPSEADLEDAWVKLQPNGGLAPEEAKKYGDKLRQGAEDQKNRDLAKTKENFKNMYRTPDGVLQMSKDPMVRQEMDASPDDDLVTKRALNRAYLASMYGKPDASPEELDQIMRAISIQNWAINNPSHETFYTKIKEAVLKSDEEEKVSKSLTNTIVSTVLEDQLTGKQSSFSESFEKFAAANPKEITAQNKDQWYQRALLVDERVRKLGESVRFPAASIIDLSKKVIDGTATELDYDRATNALRGINPKDLTQVMKVAALAVREKDPKGEMISTVMSNIGKRFDRDFNLSKVYEQDRELLLNDQINNLKSGMSIGKDANGRLAFAHPGQPLPPNTVPVSQEEYNQYWNDAHRAMDGMAIARVIQQFQETVADPIVPIFEGGLLGAAEAGVYDIAGFSKLLPLGMLPTPVAYLAIAKVTSASTYHDIRLENPNLSIESARNWANLDGFVQGAAMKFKADFLLGHYPMFKTMRTLKGLGKTTEALKVYGRWAAVHNIEENFEELAQDTMSAVIAKLYGDAHPKEVKQQSWQKLLIDIAKTRPQVAMAVGPLSLIGAGSATVRDMKNPMRDFMNPDRLKSAGLKDEQVAEVLASKDLDEAQKVFQKHYNTLTPEDVKRGFKHAASLTEKDEVDAAMADPATPTLEPVVMPDGTYKWNVLSPDGTILSSHTDPDVAETAWVRETERVKGEHWAAEQNAAAQQAAAEAAAAASDEGVAKEAEAKAEAETVSPEDRLGTAMTVEFEENVAATPEESREVAQLQSEVRAAGRGDVIALARPSDAQAGPGQASLDFIRAFERATGKRVVFVASGNAQPLSFTGVVRKGDPNTIFLDAHGDRNVLALVGHEWSHTLEHTSPELHAEMVGRMKPLIIEWAKQEGILAKEVGPEGVTNEMVANIVGDAISNENFWSVMAQKDPSLFVKVRDAVLKFLNQFIGKVQKSEFGTEAFIKDATQMRDVVADIMHRAGQGTAAAGGIDEFTKWLHARGDRETDPLTEWNKDQSKLIDQWLTEKMEGKQTPIWKVEITSQMKAGVTEGQVMFAPRRETAKAGRGKRTVASFAFAGRRAAAIETETAARMAEPEGRVAFFQKIRDRVLSLIKENDTRREGRLPPEKIDPANELARLDNAVRAKMEGIDRREQAALDKITLRVLSQFNAPADTGIKLQDLENQRQSEIEAAERDGQKTFSRESRNLSDLTFQQRLVTFERIRGLERQYKERLRGIRNVYRERGRALLQAAATDKAAAETAIKADTRLASETEKRFDVERREAERQHELRQKQIEQRAELRTRIGQQAFELKEARRRLIESIGEYNAMLKALPADLRGRIGGIVEVSKITDEEQMAAFFTRQIGKIDEVLEQHLRMEYRERINDLLATYKPKKTPGGVLTTKIGDAQQVVNDIRAMTKMDDVAVAAEIASIEAKINSGSLSPEEEAAAHQRQNLLSLFGDLESRNAATLASSHQFLKTTIAQGRAAWGAIEEARLANQRANGEAIKASLGPSSPAMAAARKDKLDRWKGAAASMYNFGQFMHDIFPSLPFVQSWVDRSRDADTGIQDFMIDVDKRFSDLVRRFTGNSVIKGGAALEALNERTIDVPGDKASKMEAIQYLLSWAQADAQARMVRDGWTDDHIETLRRETDDPLSQAISQFLRKEYDAAYNKINAVYKRMYGMDLPRITNYAPLRYEHSGLPEDVAPFGSPTSISGSTPTFAHARVKHSASLKQMDALTVYMQHMQQAAHFIHYAELVREMRGTLNNGKVKEAIGSNMGPYQADTINKWMDIIARGGTAKASEQLIMKDATAYLTKGTAIGALAFNLKSAVSQLDSAFRWMYEIPPRAWLPAFLKPGWLASVPQAWSSNAIQRRIHDGMNPISQHLMSTNNLTPGLLLKMTRLGMAPLRYTDAAGTTISSAIVFKYHYDQLIKAGASPEDATSQAAVLMDRAVHKFSQPTSLTSKSIVENTQTGVAKAGLLFMSDPRMKTALLMEAFGDIRRGDVETGVGKIVAGMAMGVLTLFAANLFRDWASDDDDEDIWTLAGFLNAMSFGQFHGVFIAGNLIDYAGTSGLAKLTGEKLPYYGARGDILTETYKRAERVLKDPTKLWSDDPDEMIKTWENVLRVMGIIAPPVAQLAGLANVAKTVLGVSENLDKTE